MFPAVPLGPGRRQREAADSTWSAPAQHVQPWLDSLAYRIDTPEGSIVITGDTEPCQSVIDIARGADMLVCMCWDDQPATADCGEANGHTGTTGAAGMAQEAGVGMLVLTHMNQHISSHGPLEKGLADIGRIYDGQVVFAEQLLRLDLRAERGVPDA